MPYHLTSDQELIRKTVRELVTELKGKPAEHIDRDRAWPKEGLTTLSGLGLMGMLVPAEKGGAGTDVVSFALALEEVATVSGTLALALNNANALGSFPIARAGSDALVAEVLPKLVTGEGFAAWGLTEPNAGSDLHGITARAKKDGDDYILNGIKSFVVGASQATEFVVFAKVPSTEGLTAFLVAADSEGVMIAPPERTMTFRGSEMAQVFFKDVRVSAGRRLGEEGEGLDLADECNALAALGAAAMSVGLMQAALSDSAAYANDREQFRMPIKKFQAIQFLVADIDAKVRASRLLTLAAADRRDQGHDARADIATAKLFAGEAAKFVTQKALRIHGGTGFMRDLPVERYNRDARALSVYAGTSEQQRAVLAAKALGL